jgi:hypothetical protein
VPQNQNIKETSKNRDGHKIAFQKSEPLRPPISKKQSNECLSGKNSNSSQKQYQVKQKDKEEDTSNFLQIEKTKTLQSFNSSREVVYQKDELKNEIYDALQSNNEIMNQELTNLKSIH